MKKIHAQANILRVVFIHTQWDPTAKFMQSYKISTCEDDWILGSVIGQKTYSCMEKYVCKEGAPMAD